MNYPDKVIPVDLAESERNQIADFLSRNGNEIARYLMDNQGKMPSSVSHGLELEMKRLRSLADKLRVVNDPNDR